MYLGTQYSVTSCSFLRLKALLITDGVYTVRNAFSKLRMDDPAGSPNAGTAINQQPPTAGKKQQWYLSVDGCDCYTMQNITSKLFLADSKANTALGTPLEQKQSSHDVTELWSITVSLAVSSFRTRQLAWCWTMARMPWQERKLSFGRNLATATSPHNLFRKFAKE